jgi:Fe2+ transport system protein FeoA
MNLLDAKIETFYTITGISSDGTDKKRLLDMGFTVGTTLFVAAAAPSGGTILVKIRGAFVGLREDAASLIRVQEKI